MKFEWVRTRKEATVVCILSVPAFSFRYCEKLRYIRNGYLSHRILDHYRYTNLLGVVCFTFMVSLQQNSWTWGRRNS